ncbi:oligosaccharide flippase family protein [Edaphobacillus lindanitolerans]|uniref:Membrane protein involved in the export of O-antigen and teichoic acid n=1 Tax=Edaphobacillus lindanitolerans TaxID=550447 RepID=A0A1U7PN91_9BACI|nr:oligosaccharide flippase family protein [Edaphobacillus lindanitolerans]SIT73655.1 Membrane protein involved in the export of O-antigen and teichoic acid [Edaphobacillus lindanitolerans]
MKSIMKKMSWIFIANVISAFSKWLIIIVIAKQLSAVEVGLYSLALAVTAPISLLGNMKLRSLFITEQNNNVGNYLRTRSITSLLSLTIMLFVIMVFYKEYFFLMFFVGLIKILDLQSDMYYAIPHKENNLKLVAKLIIWKQVVLLLVFSISLFSVKNILIALFIQVIVQFMFYMFIEKVLMKRKYHPLYTTSINLSTVKDIIKLGIPLGIVQFLFSLNANIPRYFLELFTTPVKLGIFSAIVFLLNISNTFMNSMTQVFLPKLSNLYNENQKKEFRKVLFGQLTIISIAISLLMLVIVFFFGEWILGAIYGKEYSDYKNLFILITLSVSINSISWNMDNGLMAARCIRVQPIITLISLVINIITSMWLIRKYDIMGAGVALIISSSVLLTLRIVFLSRELKREKE